MLILNLCIPDIMKSSRPASRAPPLLRNQWTIQILGIKGKCWVWVGIGFNSTRPVNMIKTQIGWQHHDWQKVTLIESLILE